MENISKKYPDRRFALIDSVASDDPKAAKTQFRFQMLNLYLFKEHEGSYP